MAQTYRRGRYMGKQYLPKPVELLQPADWITDAYFIQNLIDNPHTINIGTGSPTSGCSFDLPLSGGLEHQECDAARSKEKRILARRAVITAQKKRDARRSKELNLAKKINNVRATHGLGLSALELDAGAKAEAEIELKIERELSASYNARSLKDATNRANWFMRGGHPSHLSSRYIRMYEGSKGHLLRIDSPEWLFVERVTNEDGDEEVIYQRVAWE